MVIGGSETRGRRGRRPRGGGPAPTPRTNALVLCTCSCGQILTRAARVQHMKNRAPTFIAPMNAYRREVDRAYILTGSGPGAFD